MTYTCEEEMQTFLRNVHLDRTESALSDGLSPAEHIEKYARGFAWGPSAKTATQLTPEALCKGAPDREHIMRILGTYVTEDPGTIGLVGTIEFVNDHTITISDEGGNIDSVDTFSFQLDGDELTLTQKGLHDAWQGTFLEEAPWLRTS